MKKEDITQIDKCNDITELTSKGEVDKILREKKSLDLKEIFYYEDKPCPRLVLIIGGPGEYYH